MQGLAIEMKNICYAYRNKVPILHNINVRVPTGALYGFIGPNGSGKSTTLGLISDLIPNDVDSIYLFNQNRNDFLPMGFTKIGSLIESPALYYHMTGAENLKYICKIRNIDKKRIGESLERVGILEAKNKKVKNYSLGMKQRLAVAIALLNRPKLLLLDEPVNGLDPNGMNELRILLKNLNEKDGITIFMSSHLLDEVEKICTHIGIINQGKMVFEGTKQELDHKIKAHKVIIEVPNASSYLEILNTQSIQPIEINENEMIFKIDSDKDIPNIVSHLVQLNIPIYGIKRIENLEYQFLKLTQNK